MNKLTTAATLLTAFIVPSLASAQIFSGSLTVTFGNPGCTINTLCGIATVFLNTINFVLVPLLFAVAFIVFIYGIFKTYILSGGDSEEVKKGHSLILWGLIGFAVMVSLWGLVNVVVNTFQLTGYSAPQPPVSYPVY
jgi:hypothetical protein